MILPTPPDQDFWQQYNGKTEDGRASIDRQLLFFAKVHAQMVGTREIGLEKATERIVRWWNAGLVTFSVQPDDEGHPMIFMFVWDFEDGRYMQAP